MAEIYKAPRQSSFEARNISAELQKIQRSFEAVRAPVPAAPPIEVTLAGDTRLLAFPNIFGMEQVLGVVLPAVDLTVQGIAAPPATLVEAPNTTYWIWHGGQTGLGGVTVTFKHASAQVEGAQQLLCPDGRDLTLEPGAGMAIRRYGRQWIVVATSGYDPLADYDFSGDVTVRGEFISSGTAILGGATNFNGQVDFNADVDFNSTTSFAGNMTISGNIISIGTTTLNNVLNVTSVVNFTSTLQVGGITDINGRLDANAGLNVTGAFNHISGAFVASGSSFNVDLGTPATFEDSIILGGKINRTTGANNLDVTGVNFVRFDPTSAITVHGFAGGVDGQRVTLMNGAGGGSGNNVLLPYNSGTASLGNRILNPTTATYTMLGRSCIDMVYDGVDNFWMLQVD